MKGYMARLRGVDGLAPARRFEPVFAGTADLGHDKPPRRQPFGQRRARRDLPFRPDRAIGGAQLGQSRAARLGDRLAHHLDADQRAFGEGGQQRIEQRFGVAQTDDTASRAGQDAGQSSRPYRPGARTGVVAFEMGFEDGIVFDDQRPRRADAGFEQRLHPRQPLAVSNARVSANGRPTTADQQPLSQRTYASALP